ncbi:MAG: hypothetical protein K8R46_13700 [Pirellulales bacterium]|nr:hypothetical protein [Pirellulales bacterium]
MVNALKKRLDKTFDVLGLKNRTDLDILLAKLELLENKKRYSLLLSELFNCNDISNFKSCLVETTFAHAFESAHIPLTYEAKQSNEHHTTVDFLRETEDGRKIYFELRVIQQRHQIKKDIDTQLNLNNMYSVSLNGTGEQEEIARLQSNILSKTQDKNGQPLKFFCNEKGTFNIVVAELSEIILEAVDKDDCMLAAYGDPYVEEFARRNIFGLFQKPESNYPVHILSIADRFSHFRNTIHAILFVVKFPKSTPLVFDLRYFLIPNINLISNSEAVILNEDIRKALQPWADYPESI